MSGNSVYIQYEYVYFHFYLSLTFSIFLIQLVFEAVRSGFDGQVAIDDVAFVKGPCSLPTMCSFEGQRCGYTNNRDGLWVLQTWHATRIGPKTDHSLETEMG